MKNKFEIIDKIIEVGVYLYIIFMFLTKGEGIRNILLFTIFFLWLITFKYIENKRILIEPVSILFWGFITTILISAIFSIDPWYSFKSLREEPLKSVLLFPVISTVLADEKRLKRLIYAFFSVLLFTISVGYYSYWAHDLPLMKPDIPLRHAWHNRFAVDLNTLFPFSFILLFTYKRLSLKIVTTIIIIIGMIALVLSTSRGGIGAFLCMVVIWSIYVVNKRGISLKPILASLALMVMLSGITLYYAKPDIKDRFLHIKQDGKTFSNRTIIWSHLIAAAKEKPIFGWGYGSKIFNIDLPFQNTSYKVSPARIRPELRQPHNAFLRVLFHQGIVGLVVYVSLLFAAIRLFWKGANNTQHIKSYMLIACASILISTYVVNSIVENTHFLFLTLILGIGMASMNIKYEDSGN